jgi:hypothetical protein
VIEVIPRRGAGLGSERVRALVVLIVLVVAATAVVANTVARDKQRRAAADEGCRPGAPRADIALPAGPGDVKIKVLNGTERAGLADNVSTEFASRGFAVEKPGQSRSTVDQIAIIRYGPRTVGDAQFIMAHFLGEAEPKYDRERADGVVEVVIGAKYRQLATTTEVKQSLSVLGEAKVPPGACLVPLASASSNNASASAVRQG